MSAHRFILSLGVILLFVFLFPAASGHFQIEQAPNFSAGHSAEIFGALPIYFVENRGQLDADVLYHIKMSRGNAYFSKSSATYQFINDPRSSQNVSVENLQVQFVGANQDVKIVGLEESKALFNFYHGNDPSRWVEGSRAFYKIKYQDLFPGIDLVIFESDGLLKQEYHVRKAGSVDSIAVRYQGAQGIKVNEDGQLEIQTKSRTLVEDTPLSYQIIDGKRVLVKTEYIVEAGNAVGFKVGDYSSEYPLIIDPSLIYSTFLGGSQGDDGEGIVVDLHLNAYVVGTTWSKDFPTSVGAYDDQYDGPDVFLTKLDPTGSELLFSTFLGGARGDFGDGIAFSWQDESPVITGETISYDFPTTSGAYDRHLSGFEDIFIAKFNASGALVFSTYLGGGSDEFCPDVAIDGDGNIFVMGNTKSSLFYTTPNVIDNVFDHVPPEEWYDYWDNNIFVAKFDSSGSNLIYSTFFGEYYLGVGGIDVDFAGNAFITGYCRGSGLIPTTPNAFKRLPPGPGKDSFVACINPSGTQLIYSTYLGHDDDIGEPSDGALGTYRQRSEGISADGHGRAFVTGYTFNGFSNQEIDYDATFVYGFNATGSKRILAKNLFKRNYGNFGISVDGRGGVYVGCVAWQGDLEISPNAIQSYKGNGDLYIVKLKISDGSTVYSTYLGGSGSEEIKDMAADSFGSVYLTGRVFSFDFPTTVGAFSTIKHGGGTTDAFVTRIRDFGPAGQLFLDRNSLNFRALYQSTDRLTKKVTLQNKGKGVVNYDVTTDQGWLSAWPLSGDVRNEEDTLQISVNPQNLKPGSHKGIVKISSLDAFNSPYQVIVTLKVTDPTKQHTLSIASETGGTTNPAPGIHSYDEGTEITLAAVADSNYRFLGWSGDITATDNPIIITMDSDKSIKANYIRQYRLTLVSGEGGTVAPLPGAYVYDEGTEITLTAVPNAHYEFSHWSGDASGSDNPINVTLDSNLSITVNFILIIYSPLNFSGQKVLNRSLSQEEYINILNWQSNPNNSAIVKYRVYQIEGESRILLTELSAGTFQHWYRGVEKEKTYTYEICAVNNEGREGQATLITIQ